MKSGNRNHQPLRNLAQSLKRLVWTCPSLSNPGLLHHLGRIFTRTSGRLGRSHRNEICRESCRLVEGRNGCESIRSACWHDCRRPVGVCRICRENLPGKTLPGKIWRKLPVSAGNRSSKKQSSGSVEDLPEDLPRKICQKSVGDLSREDAGTDDLLTGRWNLAAGR